LVTRNIDTVIQVPEKETELMVQNLTPISTTNEAVSREFCLGDCIESRRFDNGYGINISFADFFLKKLLKKICIENLPDVPVDAR
jgi:hypothetical protein